MDLGEVAPNPGRSDKALDASVSSALSDENIIQPQVDHFVVQARVIELESSGADVPVGLDSGQPVEIYGEVAVSYREGVGEKGEAVEVEGGRLDRFGWAVRVSG